MERVLDIDLRANAEQDEKKRKVEDAGMGFKYKIKN